MSSSLSNTLPLLFLLAAAPQGSSHQFQDYYQGLQDPSGVSCCSEADCHPVEYTINGDHYEAQWEGRLWIVPNDRVLHQSNPTGHGTLCIYQGSILCFNPSSAT